MARRRGRRGHRKVTITKWLRSIPLGLVQLGLASALLAIASNVASALSGYMSFTFTINNNTVNVDMGFITGIIIAFAGVFLLMSGLRKVLKTSI